MLIGTSLAILALALVLERWPSRRPAPRFGNALPAGSATLVFLEGAAQVRADEATLGPGRVQIVRRAYARPGEAAPPLRVILEAQGLVRVPGLAPLLLRPSGAVVDLPLLAYHVVDGEDGRAAVFSRASATISGQAVLRLSDEGRPSERAGDSWQAAAEEDVEPDSTRFALRQERCPRTDRSSKSATLPSRTGSCRPWRASRALSSVAPRASWARTAPARPLS